MSIAKYISKQFAHPRGMGGRVATMIMNLLNKKLYKVCYNLVKEYAPDKVLDVGFGNGYTLSYLSKRKRNTHWFGIDVSLDALKMSKRNLGMKATLSIGNIEELNFEANSMDMIYTINTFYFWQNPLTALYEAKRVIKQGGIFINICYTKAYLDKLHYTNYGFTKMDSSEILELHSKAGFSKSELVDIEAGKSFYVICVK